MKRRGVVFTPEAQEQLVELYRYIEESATADVALQLHERGSRVLRKFADIPPRDDIRPGRRTTTYKRCPQIAYTVDDARISLIGVFHGGRDYERALLPDEP